MNRNRFVRRILRVAHRPWRLRMQLLRVCSWSLAAVVRELGRVGLAYVGDPPREEEVPPERVVLGLLPAFRAEAVPGLDESYELALGDEIFKVTVHDGAAEAARGDAPGATVRLRTDPLTLVELLLGRLTPADANAPGRLTVEGAEDAVERFLAVLPGGRVPSRLHADAPRGGRQRLI